ncbi:hypothetical protein [Flavobacterium sp. PL002]|uniref:hypothetical protein n=1 Tax=Flavobacterium sp. PL002 TaxID=1897058 RepID=UPI0017878177|nr:hypothetical protein [Flavobacterium sp. PL002]MBE0393854.1 hypothetical protein [Flavobacterium sp. PL002]
MKKIYFILVLFYVGMAAQNNFRLPDSLSTKSYSYFNEKIRYKVKDSTIEKIHAHSWLAKAKFEKNHNQMTMAYKALIYKFDKEISLKYADSSIAAAIKTANSELIGSAYMIKGALLFDNKEMMNALDNYLIAEVHISEIENEYLSYKLKYCIALTKYYLGHYQEAIDLFKECITYFKEENDHAYLKSLYSLGQCYTRTNKTPLDSQTNEVD